MDINSLLQLRGMWKSFCANHPKFPDFLRAVKERGAVEGQEIAFTVTYPDGKTLKAGIRLKASDVELVNGVLSILKK